MRTFAREPGASPISALDGRGWDPRVGSHASAVSLRRFVGRNPSGSVRITFAVASKPASNG
jgi:hypothetical protein